MPSVATASDRGSPQAGTSLDAKALVERQRTYFETRVTLPLEWRREQLRALERAARQHETQILDALRADLSKSAEEAYLTEVGSIYGELKNALKHVKAWMEPRRGSAPLVIQPARAYQYADPLGVTLIIAPWNYPYQLSIAPLIGALAAGCTAVLKPSEHAPETSRVLARMLTQAFPPEVVSVVEGAAEASRLLLEERWDLIFFTGGTGVGRIVAQAAAKHLTPTVLELGGKSPCIIDRSADLEVTARRIAWGKFVNAGQTCIAPDYVLIPPDLKGRFTDLVQKAVKSFYGADARESSDYGRIINARHFERVSALAADGQVAFGGERDAASRFFAPTVITDAPLSSPLMQEEIFGPLLPLVDCASIDEAIRFVRARPKPLALYSFAKDAAVNERVLAETSSGGAVANDVCVHFAAEGLPFGGVGDSGTGGYHGRASFDAFSHKKSVVKRPFALDMKLRYPPYAGKLGLFQRFL
ncbi:aldehyde dehydrogenase family protein [Corallococcus praedator]|uniref:Aldehyde dehydrogenase n=1 Tax=Corallococcus praedator TaxID=2316724 RepID=A0ABX9QPX5_9BACT|nr:MULTISPECIES: aldehyde dehydrogenase family protein [Corallococcus]RKH36025.1 aldehyde dehydrogenase family protein [Corallococcus sp. CA031C]RKI15243.1 aldehyde dehydrogenase family protein [Corallococcus praedator]